MFNGTGNVPYSVPVAPITNGGGFGNGMWGGDGGWLFIIILFALIFGWGGNGGFGGYGAGGVQGNYVLTSDFSQLSRQLADNTAMTERKLDSVTNGLCDGFYTIAQQINGVNTAILTNANANQMAMMQGFNNVNTAISDCCCKTQTNIADLKYTVGSTGAEISRGVERGFSDTNYNLATQSNMLDRTVSDKFCQTNFNMQTNTRDVIDSQNAGTQAILAKLDAIETNRKDEKIAELTAKNFDLRLAASQQAQNAYLVGELGYKCPQPAYVVQPPQRVSFATNCNGMATFANGCNCCA